MPGIVVHNILKMNSSQSTLLIYASLARYIPTFCNTRVSPIDRTQDTSNTEMNCELCYCGDEYTAEMNVSQGSVSLRASQPYLYEAALLWWSQQVDKAQSNTTTAKNYRITSLKHNSISVKLT